MKTTAVKNDITTINPTTGKNLTSYKYMTDEEVNNTIDKSHKAFLDWKTKSFEERGTIIKAIGKELLNYKPELAELMTNEMGKLLKQSQQEVDLCAGICDYSADNASEFLKNEERELQDGSKGIITYAPIGVIYGIQPWNYPSYQVIRYTITNLMAGNSILLKHAANVTGTAKLLETIFTTAGLPKGLFSVLLIDHDQSDLVITNKKVRGITLTGSPKAGEIIGEKAGKALKKSVLELGSNDAYIVLEDADIELAVKTSVMGRIYNNGETCIAAKRFVVVDAVYDQFKEAFVKAMKDLKMGNPMDSDTKLGPIAREDLRDTLHEQVEKSIENGAKLL